MRVRLRRHTRFMSMLDWKKAKKPNWHVTAVGLGNVRLDVQYVETQQACDPLNLLVEMDPLVFNKLDHFLVTAGPPAVGLIVRIGRYSVEQEPSEPTPTRKLLGGLGRTTPQVLIPPDAFKPPALKEEEAGVVVESTAEQPAGVPVATEVEEVGVACLVPAETPDLQTDPASEDPTIGMSDEQLEELTRPDPMSNRLLTEPECAVVDSGEPGEDDFIYVHDTRRSQHRRTAEPMVMYYADKERSQLSIRLSSEVLDKTGWSDRQRVQVAFSPKTRRGLLKRVAEHEPGYQLVTYKRSRNAVVRFRAADVLCLTEFKEPLELVLRRASGEEVLFVVPKEAFAVSQPT